MTDPRTGAADGVPQVLRYDRGALAADAARGLAGLAATLVPPLVLENILSWVAAILLSLSALFAVYLLRTLLRHRTEIHVSDTAIAERRPALPDRQIAWAELERVKLSYYAAPRARPGSGLMTLTLLGPAGKIVVESSLNSFDSLIEDVAEICARGEARFDPNTAHNFEAIGLPIGDP
jgi:hypothetical protein